MGNKVMIERASNGFIVSTFAEHGERPTIAIAKDLEAAFRMAKEYLEQGG